QLVDPDADHVPVCFDLFDWKGLRADGTLERRRALGHLALPADIALFRSVRVLLLRKPALKQEGYAGRLLERMTADLRVEAVLNEAETLTWLERLRKAPH